MGGVGGNSRVFLHLWDSVSLVSLNIRVWPGPPVVRTHEDPFPSTDVDSKVLGGV